MSQIIISVEHDATLDEVNSFMADLNRAIDKSKYKWMVRDVTVIS